MKISDLSADDITKAAILIRNKGIDESNLFNNYYILTNYGEYPFIQSVRLALEEKYNTKVARNICKSTFENRKVIEELGFKINHYDEEINFFRTEEIVNYISVAGKSYRKAEAEDKRFGNLIKPLVRKINKWAELSVVDDYEFRRDNHWQWSGTFKTYLWIRIYKKEQTDKAFFVFGLANDGNLYIQLNCLRSNHTAGTTEVLQDQIVREVDNYLNSSNHRMKIINLKSIDSYDWDRLIKESTDFILENSSLYDEISTIVNEIEDANNLGNIESESNKDELIIESEPPENINSRAEKTLNKKDFHGRDINWKKRQESSTKLGASGENKVIEFERNRLNRLGLYKLADQVKKVKDGEGYDVLSFNSNGDKKYIEVKTTVKDKNEPFQITLNEWRFWSLNHDNYCIYRLFNYKITSGKANFYKITGHQLKKMNFEPILFEVSK